MNTDFDLDILPVKEDGTEQKLPRPLHPHLPNIASGQVGILISPVKTGKSTTFTKIVLTWYILFQTRLIMTELQGF